MGEQGRGLQDHSRVSGGPAPCSKPAFSHPQPGLHSAAAPQPREVGVPGCIPTPSKATSAVLCGAVLGVCVWPGAHCPRWRTGVPLRCHRRQPLPALGCGRTPGCSRTGCALPGPGADGQRKGLNEKSVLMQLPGRLTAILPLRTRRFLCRRRRKFYLYLGKHSCGESTRELRSH